MGFKNLLVDGFVSSFSTSLSKPSVDFENQGNELSRLSGDLESRLEDDLRRGNLISIFSKTSEPFDVRLEGLKIE